MLENFQFMRFSKIVEWVYFQKMAKYEQKIWEIWILNCNLGTPNKAKMLFK